MKYLFAVLFFTVISFQASADAYDGAWVTDTRPGEYFMVRSVGETIAVIRLSDNYEIFVGRLNKKDAHIETFKGDVSFKADINFVSENEATLTVLDCSPVDECDFHPGSVLAFKKFF